MHVAADGMSSLLNMMQCFFDSILIDFTAKVCVSLCVCVCVSVFVCVCVHVCAILSSKLIRGPPFPNSTNNGH